jgi:prevent-host-death family protein
MRTVNVHEAKTELSRLLEAVEAGERIVIARAGHPVAILSSYRSATRRRKLGLFPDQAKIHDDFDELPADIQAAFSGDSI